MSDRQKRVERRANERKTAKVIKEIKANRQKKHNQDIADQNARREKRKGTS